jgi:hypothetical protein
MYTHYICRVIKDICTHYYTHIIYTHACELLYTLSHYNIKHVKMLIGDTNQ